MIGLLSALLTSVVLVFAFSVVISYLPIDPGFIRPINGIIKAFSVLVGALLGLRGDKGGAIKGMVFGAIYWVLSYLLFCAIAGAFDFGISILFDILLCTLVGGIVGVIKVNAK